MNVVKRLKAWIARRDREGADRDVRRGPPELPPDAHERPQGMPESGPRRG